MSVVPSFSKNPSYASFTHVAQLSMSWCRHLSNDVTTHLPRRTHKPRPIHSQSLRSLVETSLLWTFLTSLPGPAYFVVTSYPPSYPHLARPVDLLGRLGLAHHPFHQLELSSPAYAREGVFRDKVPERVLLDSPAFSSGPQALRLCGSVAPTRSSCSSSGTNKARKDGMSEISSSSSTAQRPQVPIVYLYTVTANPTFPFNNMFSLNVEKAGGLACIPEALQNRTDILQSCRPITPLTIPLPNVINTPLHHEVEAAGVRFAQFHASTVHQIPFYSPNPVLRHMLTVFASTQCKQRPHVRHILETLEQWH
ncbi:hypothetical protein CPAR01_06629 [Colletotrichum paranaense]|uniref:Uncharacterized protein n=1 Tax=Colletotrichum paranaense TaxID=1914294 RepID=A0ABQ9SM90_9PEZI|nr:uncharacterized protein CPAR01_06629 [Colletotrichum paranaense]KAK1540640.1 hypothetical protein CPAR01_06629 [Colletotrichum paranaense]